MEWLKQFGRWAWGNLGNLAIIAGWLVSAGFFPTLLALTANATPLQYGIAAVAGLLVFATIRAIWHRATMWKMDARMRRRAAGNSSPFDPMENVYRDKRLYLRDLAPVGRKHVRGRRFINCELIGPGNIILGLKSGEQMPWPDIRNNWFHNVDFIQIAKNAEPHNAVAFVDCHFDSCNLYSLNLLFWEREREDCNWITPSPNQTKLLEDRDEK